MVIAERVRPVRPGEPAHVLNEIKAANLNIQRMENIVIAGAEAAIARIELDATLEPETMDRIRGDNSDILETSLIAL